MIKTVFYSLAAANLASMVAGECANACNGHGKCTSYDMCTCNRNWQANDCSERVCQFGLAHVDTPKGDLNHDGVIGDPTQTVAVNSFTYPYGTTEQFPRMQDSDLMNLDESAHYYMECSNKGTCNRDTGDCECFDGYDGAACQRASCPGFPDSCSGHGVCKTIRQLADADNGNIYELWDKHSTMGCECDAGFFGPDCSQRKCKYGVDPLYLDDSATIKYSTFNFGIVSRYDTDGATSQIQGGSPTDGVSASDNDGHFAIRFFDMHGEDWLTAPIKYGAECSDVIAALNALPNNVIPEMDDSFCTKIAVGPDAEETLSATSAWNIKKDEYFAHDRKIYLPMAFWTKDLSDDASRRTYLDNSGAAAAADHESEFFAAGTVYQIHFFNNPGAFREPEIEIFLDGSRPSITDANSDGSLFTRVWTDGQQGETVDYVADHCDGVTFTLQYEDSAAANVAGREGPRDVYLAGLDKPEIELLKACLGTSDFDETNNVDIHEWDYGDDEYPHFVKIVRSVTTYNDGGYYAALYWDSTGEKFKLFNNLLTSDEDSTAYLRPTDTIAADTDVYEIYTTKGTLALTAADSEVVFGFASREIIMGNMEADKTSGYFSGDLSCEGAELYPDLNGVKVEHCLNKGDLFTVFASADDHKPSNPSHLNLYTAEKLYKKQANLIVDDYTPNVELDDTDGSVNLVKYKHLEFGTHTIVTDLSTNWAHADVDKAKFRVYKFFPADESKYEYVAQCSNRGICDESSGVCKCFGGYTGDDCSEQNSLAV